MLHNNVYKYTMYYMKIVEKSRKSYETGKKNCTLLLIGGCVDEFTKFPKKITDINFE